MTLYVLGTDYRWYSFISTTAARSAWTSLPHLFFDLTLQSDLSPSHINSDNAISLRRRMGVHFLRHYLQTPITERNFSLIESELWDIPLETSSFDPCATPRAKDGDSPTTLATSSKGKSTFKQFIRKTTSTASSS